jgi:hypothetical protein
MVKSRDRRRRASWAMFDDGALNQRFRLPPTQAAARFE